MPMSTDSTGEKTVKIGQYLANIWTKDNNLVFLGHLVYSFCVYSSFYTVSKNRAKLLLSEL